MTRYNKSSANPVTTFPSIPAWWGGTLAGNKYTYAITDTASDVWYENRDQQHATFESLFTDVIDNIDQNLNLNQFWPGSIVIGNASLASTASESVGSQTRQIDDFGLEYYMALASQMWKMGYLFFCPEHQDYDSIDWFKKNAPYWTTTQGSSGSEGTQLQRCLMIVAAIPSGVRQWMIDNQRVGDVVTYLMRSNLYGGYLDPLVHRPCVTARGYNQADLDLAASLTTGTMPPTLRINVISDSYDQRDQFNAPTTTYFRTDEAIGLKRIDTTPTRTIVCELISNKTCTYTWIKAQGACTISYLNGDHSQVSITIPAQANGTVLAQDGHSLTHNRVDVVAVANDGTHYSAPVYLTEYTIPSAREGIPQETKMNEIGITADNSFHCKINGADITNGDDWQQWNKQAVAWAESNLIEIEVRNQGGPGGLLVSAQVGDIEYGSNETWQASLDRTNWKPATVLGPYGVAPWGTVNGVNPNTNAKWIWLAEANENATVYFRRTLGKPVDLDLEEYRLAFNKIKQIIRDLEVAD